MILGYVVVNLRVPQLEAIWLHATREEAEQAADRERRAGAAVSVSIAAEPITVAAVVTDD